MVCTFVEVRLKDPVVFPIDRPCHILRISRGEWLYRKDWHPNNDDLRLGAHHKNVDIRIEEDMLTPSRTATNNIYVWLDSSQILTRTANTTMSVTVES